MGPSLRRMYCGLEVYHVPHGKSRKEAAAHVMTGSRISNAEANPGEPQRSNPDLMGLSQQAIARSPLVRSAH